MGRSKHPEGKIPKGEAQRIGRNKRGWRKWERKGERGEELRTGVEKGEFQGEVGAHDTIAHFQKLGAVNVKDRWHVYGDQREPCGVDRIIGKRRIHPERFQILHGRVVGRSNDCRKF